MFHGIYASSPTSVLEKDLKDKGDVGLFGIEWRRPCDGRMSEWA